MLIPNSKVINVRAQSRHRGFTLIEMAMVMLIIGMLLSGLFVALGDSANNRNRITANAELEGIKEALFGYAQTVGRLPCPAVLNSVGVEAPNGGGVCTSANGFVPAATLGIQGAVDSNGLLVDPWGNPYRYSVAILTPSPRSFTTVAGLKLVFSTPGALVPGGGFICIAGAVSCGAPVFANTVPALVYSMGADYGYYSSAIQLENASTAVTGAAPHRLATDNNFVNGGYATDGVNAFDDILVWLAPNILFSRMIAAGKLP